MAERAFASKRSSGSRGWLQRKAPLRLGGADDRFEREADRVADAVTSGRSASRPGVSLSRVPVTRVQRDNGKPKSEEEKYKEAAKKLGEAFLATDIGKKLREKVEQDPLVKGAKEAGESFIGSLPGKVITGAAAVGAVSALAATHKELPAQIPEIPLDKLTPGLKVKITYEGPVDNPTKAMITFSYTEQIRTGKKPAKTKTEIQREENARMAAEHARFRAGLRYAPGTPEAKRQQEEEGALKRAAFSGVGKLPEFGKLKTFPGLAPTPSYGFKLKPFSLLDEELKLKPLDEAGEPKEQEKKKEEGTAVQRKATADHAAGSAPAIVRDALRAPGRPLDAATRADMEQRFGCDFGDVHVHTDAHAERSALALSARAYTLGGEVVFAAGQYSPYTAEGRRLLAHELAHVVQQQGRSDAASSAPLIRRKVDERLQSPAEALREALKGDDDDVRDLTRAPQWPSVKLTPEEAAALLALLLEGSTLDDDEIAGLAVLRKALALRLFDDTLGKLNDKRRFRQLLDDYHGDEYRLLLDLLSRHIERLNIKAIYLDAFIAMWWVREHEERAIVVLLERTAANDLFALLARKDRQKELRDAIDSATLSVRYERIAGKVNELRQADLAAQLKRIFTAKAKTSQAAGKRTPADVTHLLAAAATDLADELFAYRAELNKALAGPKADADAIAEINRQFEERLGKLLEAKQLEFDLELKYNLEFSRLLRDARGRSWKKEDLQPGKGIDKILAQIPAEILRANPKFKAIRRAEDPELGGQAPYGGKEIILFGSLKLGHTAHELGHVVSYDDGEKLQNEFNKAFGWEELSGADLIRLIPDRKARQALVGKLDDDRRNEREESGDRHRHGDYFYRYNRYGGAPYLRHPKDACFITGYAATDRYDDFAESFEVYLTDPASLHKKCPDKYAFMRQKVFVRYLFGKLAAQIVADFDKERDAGLKGLVLPGGLPEALRTGHLTKLREALKKEIDATAGRLETRALGEKPSDKMKRVPFTGTEARDAAKPYRQRLTDLLGLLGHVVKPWQAFSSDVDQFVAAAPGEHHLAALALRMRLVESFRDDALRLIDPYAARILAGQHIQLAAWPQMDALMLKYRNAVNVAAKYLPAYQGSFGDEFVLTPAVYASTEEEEVGAAAWKILRRYRQGDPRRQKLKDYILEQRAELEEQAEKLRSDIFEQVKAGVPPTQAKLTTPEALLKAYERDIKDFIKREGLQLQRRADPAADGVAAAHLVEPTLHGPGTALPRHLRAEMELRFGYDFSRVRVHADSGDAAAAKAAGALAYTVGNHVVFAAGQYQPLGRTGRRLLAHELTHVVQQGAARALGHAAAAQAPGLQRNAEMRAGQAGPAVDREIVDLPESLEEEVAAEPQAAPSAGMPEARLPVVPPEHATEREASEIAERIARAESAERLPAITERLAPGKTLNRDNVPKPGEPARKDIAFVMGSDKPKSGNRFYTAARKYFKANLAGVELIDDPQIRDLAAVFAYLAKRGEAIGTLYLISHAADDGTLSFPLQPGDKDKKVDYRELRDALKTSPDVFKLPAGVVDKSTTLRIKGCRLGQSERMLGVIGAAFGAGKVVAPKHRQYYRYETTTTGKGKGRKVEEATYEGFKTYFVERRGEAKLTRDEQLDAFAAKYANLSHADWETLVPKKGSKVARKVERQEALSFSFTDPADDKQALDQARKDFAASKDKFVPAKVVGSAATPTPFEATLSDGSKKTFKGKAVKYSFENAKGDTGYVTYSVPTDEKEIVESAKADESVPEAYDWSLQKNRKGATVTYIALGVRTVYSLDRYIVAKLGKEPEVKRLYAPPEAAAEYYGEALRP